MQPLHLSSRIPTYQSLFGSNAMIGDDGQACFSVCWKYCRLMCCEQVRTRGDEKGINAVAELLEVVIEVYNMRVRINDVAHV